MRMCILVLLALAAPGCSLKYEPVPSAAAPPYMAERVAAEYPGATLEHVARYTPANPWATDYVRWRGLAMRNGRVIAEVHAGLGDRVVFEASPGD